MTEAWLDFSLLTRAGFPLERYAAGDKIFVQDDEGSAMYVVRSGRVNIMTYGTVLETVGPNGMFGEMALIDGSPRSATAVAMTPVRRRRRSEIIGVPPIVVEGTLGPARTCRKIEF